MVHFLLNHKNNEIKKAVVSHIMKFTEKCQVDVISDSI